MSLKRNRKIVTEDPNHEGNTIVYEGNTKNGVPHGKGQLTIKMGNTALRQLFQGKFKEGSTFGKGKRNFSIDAIFFIGGDCPTDEKNPFSSFSFFTENWEINSSYKSCRFPRSIGKLMFHEHYFYYIGGFDGNRAVPHVERFDIFNSTWEKMCPLIYRRTSFCSFLYDSNIYVCGGLMGSVIHRNIEKYDFRKNKWEIFGSLAMERSGFMAHVWNDQYYILGGTSFNENILPLEIFDLKTKKSIVYTNIIFPCYYCASALLRINDKPYIFVAGGSPEKYNSNKTTTNRVFSYSIEENSLTEISSLHVGRVYCSLVVFHNELYCMGGHNDNMEYKLPIEKYNFSENKWETQSILPTSMSGSSFLAVENYNISLEGNWKHGHLDGKVIIQTNQKNIEGKYKKGKKEGFFNDIYYVNDIPVCYQQVLWDAKVKKIKNVPDNFKCPISLEIMNDPVIIETGITFDKKNIEEWFVHRNTCPLTRKVVDKKCIPNNILKTMIQEFIEKKIRASQKL